MTRSEIVTRLRDDHTRFAVMISSLSDEEFMLSVDGKWSAGHQLDHIYRSVKPLRTAVRLPGFVPRLLFGKPQKDSRSFEEVVARYQDKLTAGGKAIGGFVPKPVQVTHRNSLIIKMTDTVETLARSLEKKEEAALDTIQLPHPLMGRITLREMLHFTIYHVGHHHKATLRNLGK